MLIIFLPYKKAKQNKMIKVLYRIATDQYSHIKENVQVAIKELEICLSPY